MQRVSDRVADHRILLLTLQFIRKSDLHLILSFRLCHRSFFNIKMYWNRVYVRENIIWATYCGKKNYQSCWVKSISVTILSLKWVSIFNSRIRSIVTWVGKFQMSYIASFPAAERKIVHLGVVDSFFHGLFST